ncbi:copper amine oxidase N-terminal domain-containing protein [Thermosyntropha sp.]|uniref:copper amine oxidase N-terminal domain-containing protein n=1 Tax=Thermosyntropha sp. TaxID=2740820 RepID=UPI0025DA74F2|nr:copper amine oxidase N-terminal domain-containing protein [Thermosyntropha sp.]MBO8159063.1 copper amine oxidase N-terminal domain-containing protein [Thermosyntropha sp.]
MIKARSKKLSILLVLAMLMTMFVGLGTASAGTTYETLTAPTVSTDTVNEQTLGTVKVNIPDKRVFDTVYAEYLTISLPSGVEFTSNSNVAVTSSQEGGVDELTTVLSAKSSATTWELAFVRNAAAAGDNEADLLIKFENILVKSGSGNVDVTFMSSGSVFPTGTATIAKIGSGATQTIAKSVKTIGEDGGEIDTIIIRETIPGVLKAGDEIELRLPSGLSWDYSNAVVAGAWGFSGQSSSTGEFSLSGTDNVLILKLESGFTKSTVDTTAGRINIGISGNYLKIKADDDINYDEIEVSVSSNTNDDVTEEDVVVAKYGSYGVEVEQSEVEEVIAGQTGQDIGEFYIKENIAGSLIANRSIVLELPAGVKWSKLPQVSIEDGSDVFGSNGFDYVGSSERKISIDVASLSTEAATIKVEKGEVYVEPGFEGDIEIEVSGSAGAEGTVKVAEAVKAVEISVDEVPDIVVGEQGVKVADITIKENKAGAILAGTDNNQIVIALDGGYKFYKEPTVGVVAGNLEIDDVDINSNDELVITIDTDSTKASTIKISDVYITGYRYAPTGPVVATLVEAEGTVGNGTGSTALDEGYIKDGATGTAEFSEVSAGEVVIANCVTPAEGAGTGTFKIGSSIYYVGGVAKVMDVAPYIKDARTYVPMRYLGEMLGAEVAWDDAARTVTLTKGDDVVVFTIGSTTYTVNGEAKTADVAPEIVNSRTMLPARFVAEAFGAVVGWDAGTQTVLIQQ